MLDRTPKQFKEGDLITIRARTGRATKVAVVFHQQGRDIFYRTVRADRSLGRLDTIVCTSDLISQGPKDEVLKLVKKGTKIECTSSTDSSSEPSSPSESATSSASP